MSLETDKPTAQELITMSKLYHGICIKCYKETQHCDTIKKVVDWANANGWAISPTKVFASMSIHWEYICPTCAVKHTNLILQRTNH